MQYLKILFLLLLALLSGCTSVARQSTAVWGLMWFKEDPVPAYVSPMLYEKKDCQVLSDYHRIMGDFANSLNKQLGRRMKDIAVPEDKKISQWPYAKNYVEKYNLPIKTNTTWYEAFVDSWGHYEAIHKAQLLNGCGLSDPYGLIPWYKADFEW